MQCVILLGGKGTRMASLTNNKIPKCMLSVKGIPIIDYQIQNLINNGVTNILLSVNHLQRTITNYVKSKRWGDGIVINFVEDGDTALGTGGALRKALSENKLQEKFMILYGDSFLTINFMNVINHYLSQNKPALMTVYKNIDTNIKNNAQIDKGLVRYNKLQPLSTYQYIDYGLNFLTSKIVKDHIPEKMNFDLATTFTEISNKSMMIGYEVSDKFYDLGSVEGFQEFKKMVILDGI